MRALFYVLSAICVIRLIRLWLEARRFEMQSSNVIVVLAVK